MHVQDLVRVIDRRRHQFRRLAAGVAEHDALVARALVLVAARRRRPARCRRTAACSSTSTSAFAPVEAVLLVADVLDRRARRLVDRPWSPRSGPRTSPAMTTRLVVASVSQATRMLIGIEPGLRAFAEEQIDDLVGNAVADLVGMAFGNRFAGELIILPGHSRNLPRASRALQSLRQAHAPASDRRRSENAALLTGGVRLVKPITGRIVRFTERACASVYSRRRRQRFDEIEDALAHLRVSDLREGAVELQAFAGRQEIDDIGAAVGLGERRLRRRRPTARPRRRRPAGLPARARVAADGWRRSGWRLSRISEPAGTSRRALRRACPGSCRPSAAACAPARRHVCRWIGRLSSSGNRPIAELTNRSRTRS